MLLALSIPGIRRPKFPGVSLRPLHGKPDFDWLSSVNNQERPMARYPAFVPIDTTRTELGGISRPSVYKLVNEFELIQVHVGRRSFITGDSLAAYVDKLTQAALAKTADDELIDEELALK
jgi:hypothetical protein